MSMFRARKARDTLTKLLYAHVFQSVVFFINRAFSCVQIDRNTSIIILDIAGFGK